MRRIVLALVAIVAFAITGKAQSNSDRLSLGVGCLYQNGLDLTLSYDHEVSVRRQEVIPVASWEASTSDMNTIMYCVVAGSCSARSRPI